MDSISVVVHALHLYGENLTYFTTFLTLAIQSSYPLNPSQTIKFNMWPRRTCNNSCSKMVSFPCLVFFFKKETASLFELALSRIIISNFGRPQSIKHSSTKCIPLMIFNRPKERVLLCNFRSSSINCTMRHVIEVLHGCPYIHD